MLHSYQSGFHPFGRGFSIVQSCIAPRFTAEIVSPSVASPARFIEVRLQNPIHAAADETRLSHWGTQSFDFRFRSFYSVQYWRDTGTGVHFLLRLSVVICLSSNITLLFVKLEVTWGCAARLAH